MPGLSLDQSARWGNIASVGFDWQYDPVRLAASEITHTAAEVASVRV